MVKHVPLRAAILLLFVAVALGATPARGAAAPPTVAAQDSARSAVTAVKRAWRTGHTAERLLTLESLARFDDPLCAAQLLEILGKGEIAVFPAARRILSGYVAPATVARIVRDGLGSNEALVREQSLLALADGRPAGVDWSSAAAAALSDSDVRVRAAAVYALGRARAEAQAEALLALGVDPSERVRMAVPAALTRVAGRRALPALLSLAQDPRWRVRLAVAQALADLKSFEAVAALIELLAAETGRLREDIHALLVRLTGEDKGLDVIAWRALLATAPEDLLERGDRLALGVRPDLPRYASSMARYYSIATLSLRFVLATDVSGSMAVPMSNPRDERPGTRMDVARAELLRLIDTLDADRRFDLLRFDDRLHVWQGRLVAADDRQRRAAREEVGRYAPGGATNMYAALAAVFDAAERALDSPIHSDDSPDTLFLLSDGAPTAGELRDAPLLLAWAEERNRSLRLRIHCISLTNEPECRALLQRLAQIGDGRYVEPSAP